MTGEGFSCNLSGRTVLVTGASSGAGRHFSEILAANGARVAIAARRIERLVDLEASILATGGEALAIPMDVTDEASTIAAFDTATEAFGPVDSVVCNAGVAIGGSALGLDAEDFDRIVGVNLRGVFLTAREAARRMIADGAPERRHGRVVIISSVTAHFVQPGNPVYSATKAGVTQMGRVMARDWATKGVNVNVICPGYMRTELTDSWLELDKAKELLAGFPRRRVMEIGTLDPMLLYLCSDASAQITGSVFTIDDGQTL
jgi:NAD(P)-dependent dehydrogenase (short-subunit alcohol dehydrogenase family)